MTHRWKLVVGFGLTYILLLFLCNRDFATSAIIKNITHGITLAWAWGWCMDRCFWGKPGRDGGSHGPHLDS